MKIENVKPNSILKKIKSKGKIPTELYKMRKNLFGSELDFIQQEYNSSFFEGMKVLVQDINVPMNYLIVSPVDIPLDELRYKRPYYILYGFFLSDWKEV